MHTTQFGRVILASVLFTWGCSSGHSSGGKGGSGGSTGVGGSTQSGGAGGRFPSSSGTSTNPSGGSTGPGGTTSASGGTTTSGGGAQATGGKQTGGTTDTGGKSGTGGSTGGNLGGIKTGGSTGALAGNTSVAGTTGRGGTTSSGGATGAGGTTSIGGATSAGGTTSIGGATSAGGTISTGGATSKGGTSAGGATGLGGSTGVSPGSAIVSLDRTKQTMEGFGISDIGSSFSETEADMLFDQSKGIGLSILRIAMGSDGNPMDSPSRCYSDIKKASARGVERFIGTLWSAPTSYMTRDSVNHGAHLNPDEYEDWATTIAAFSSKVKENTGVDLYAMSAQYEPDYCGAGTETRCSDNYSTMLYTPEEMVAFLKVLGPKLRALSPPVKVIAPEVSEWLRLWSNNSASGAKDPLGAKYDYGHALAKDAAAWAQVDIVGTHQYDTQVAEPWPSDVPQTKPVWMTEMSGVRLWPEAGPSSDIKNGVAVAGWIHDAIVNGLASAWCWWAWKMTGTQDNEGLLLENGTDTKRHYTLGNYSKFIRPGYVRVGVAGSVSSDVLLSAYKGGDGTVVIVAINKSGTLATVPITIAGGTAPASLTPWVTSASDSLASSAAVPVTGGAFTATLASMTVTTFVGK